MAADRGPQRRADKHPDEGHCQHRPNRGNRGGRPLHTAEAIRADLATNMRYTVRWFDALTVAVEMGARVLVEAPPGQVLTDIAREAYPDVHAIAASTTAFDQLVATVRRRLERPV